MEKAIRRPRSGRVIRSTKVANRRIAIRARLLDVGARLFAARGIDQVSVEEIIEEAGISRATFYGFFANKNELAASILDPVFEAGIAELRKLAGASPEDAADGLVRIYQELWSQYREALLLTASMDESLYPYIRVPHDNFSAANLQVLEVIGSGGLLRNGSPELSLMVLAKTGIPLLRVYMNRPGMESVYRDTMLALLTDNSASEEN